MSSVQLLESTRFLSRFTVLFSLGLFISSGTAHTHEIVQSQARELVQQGTIQPLPQIMSQAFLHNIGRILEVELENVEGKYIYAIEALDPQGVVREYKLNAQDGSLLPLEPED